jgi:hypothetical protein
MMCKRSLIAIAAFWVLSTAGFVHAQQDQTALHSNMRKLALAIAAYMEDNAAHFPPMKTPAAMKKAVLTYAKTGSIFLDFAGGAPFVPNPYFSKKQIDNIPKSDFGLILFYDPTPDHGSHYVCLADGHIKKLSLDQWKTLKRASKIP